MWRRDLNDVTHRKRARRILGDLGKVRVLPRRKKVDFRSLAEALWRCRTWWGADGKVSIERLCLSPYVEKPLNSKVIKSFVPELTGRKCFSCFGIPMFYVYMLWTFCVRSTYPHQGYVTHSCNPCSTRRCIHSVSEIGNKRCLFYCSQLPVPSLFISNVRTPFSNFPTITLFDS